MALLLVVVGFISVAWYRSEVGGQIMGPSANSGLNVPPASAATVSIGNGGPVITYTTSGTIADLTGSSIKVKTADGSIASLAIDANTKFESLGPVKSTAEMQKEMDAYNAQVKLLLQDPVKNKEALAALVPPPPQARTPMTLADFTVGEQVEAAAVSKNSSGVYIAYSIVKDTAQH